jgi:hypothetical protein
MILTTKKMKSERDVKCNGMNQLLGECIVVTIRRNLATVADRGIQQLATTGGFGEFIVANRDKLTAGVAGSLNDRRLMA